MERKWKLLLIIILIFTTGEDRHITSVLSNIREKDTSNFTFQFPTKRNTPFPEAAHRSAVQFCFYIQTMKNDCLLQKPIPRTPKTSTFSNVVSSVPPKSQSTKSESIFSIPFSFFLFFCFSVQM